MNDRMTKIEIVTRSSKFEELKEALNKIGVQGMTMTQVLGCGTQKGITEYYRGVPYEMNLLPKVKVEIVVCTVPVELVIETAEKVLNTGAIGDGKIFVYDVSTVVRIRTGERDKEALK
jgi:nitrogen regulatory protein PII